MARAQSAAQLLGDAFGVAAIIPAGLYFFAIFSQVALRARRHHLAATQGEMPRILPVLARGGHFLLAIAALVAPFFYGASPQRAALIGVTTLFVLSMLRPATRVPLARRKIAGLTGKSPVKRG